MNALALPPGNPMTRALMSILVCEAITFGLAVPGMIWVDHVSPVTAGLAGGVVALLPLVAAFLLRGRIGWALAWLAQVGGIALGIMTPWMYLMGGIFALLWAVSFVLGRRLPSS